jgi:hypothetical protein
VAQNLSESSGGFINSCPTTASLGVSELVRETVVRRTLRNSGGLACPSPLINGLEFQLYICHLCIESFVNQFVKSGITINQVLLALKF